jgi:hypothetical protein
MPKLVSLHTDTYDSLKMLRDVEGGTMDSTVSNLLILHGIPTYERERP